MGYNGPKKIMKKIVIFLALVLFILDFANAQAYRTINVVSTPPSSNRSSQSPTGERLPNISVTVGQQGNWTYRFYSNGTFEKHEFTKNSYGRIIEDKGVKTGTYYIMKNEYGSKQVYLRYSTGYEQRGTLRYESGRVVFSTKDMRHEEMND